MNEPHGQHTTYMSQEKKPIMSTIRQKKHRCLQKKVYKITLNLSYLVTFARNVGGEFFF